jgi:Xaa-Pro aminopeptidase
LENELENLEIGACIVATEANFFYLTGYDTPSWAMTSRPIALVVSPGHRSVVVISEAEREAIAAYVKDVDVVGYTEPALSPAGELEFGPVVSRHLTEVLADRNVSTLGYELSAHYPPSQAIFSALRDRYDREPVDVTHVLWHLRRQKTTVEVAHLRRVASALGEAYRLFESRAAPGQTEKALFALLHECTALAGAHLLFGSVRVGAGLHGPLLGPASDRTWENDDVLLVDAVVRHGGYCADFGRIYIARRPSRSFAAAYAMIAGALDEARHAIGIGEPVAAVATATAAATGMRVEDGGGRFGHGIGIDAAEPPSINPNDPSMFVDGMTLCLEPNKLSDFGWLVSEEEVVITAGGVELMSPEFPREVISLSLL